MFEHNFCQHPNMDGTTNNADRQKGVTIETEDSTHELTVYVFNNEQRYADAYMAINCVEFPSARNYQYFVFSSGGDSFNSQFLITPCEDSTIVSVRPSHVFTHPNWVNPSSPHTNPASTTGQDESHYNRPFQRFDTLMLSSFGDLTGTIIISDKPLSVFVGHHVEPSLVWETVITLWSKYHLIQHTGISSSQHHLLPERVVNCIGLVH